MYKISETFVEFDHLSISQVTNTKNHFGKWHFNMTMLLALRAFLHPWLLWLLACWRHELALVAANRVCTQETHTRETTNHKHENEKCPGTQTEYSTEPKWSRTTALTSHASPNWNWTELRRKPSATSWIQHVHRTKHLTHHDAVLHHSALYRFWHIIFDIIRLGF